jgi:hypothetical protein
LNQLTVFFALISSPISFSSSFAIGTANDVSINYTQGVGLGIRNGNIQIGREAGQNFLNNPDTTGNFLFGQYGGQNFESGSGNVFLHTGGSSFISGSNNVLVGRNYSTITGGTNNVILGGYDAPETNINSFMSLGNSDTSFITKRQSEPIRMSESLTITGSLNVSSLSDASGSFIVTTDSTGTLTKSPYSAVTSNLFSVGDFYSTQTQTLAAGVSGSVTYNNTGTSFGVSLVSSSRLTIANAGVYSITFSAQLLGDGGQDTIYMWLKKNGTNVADTGTKMVVKNNEEHVMTVEYIVQAAASDYYEIVWQNTTGDGDLKYYAASGNIPAIPSIITTVKQVR